MILKTEALCVTGKYSKKNRFSRNDYGGMQNTVVNMLYAILCVLKSSASFLAEISVRSPRKLLIFIIYKNKMNESVKNKILFYLEKRSTAQEQGALNATFG